VVAAQLRDGAVVHRAGRLAVLLSGGQLIDVRTDGATARSATPAGFSRVRVSGR